MCKICQHICMLFRAICRGVSQKKEDEPFRKWFSCIGELRSLIPSVPLLAITATVSTSWRRRIKRKLSMGKNCIEVVQNPDRPNIRLAVEHRKSNESFFDIFDWIICDIGVKDTPRRVIFCRTIVDCSQIYLACKRVLSKDQMKHVEMFHSKTNDEVKEDIRKDMGSENGKLQLLLCTNAAGMGVNFARLHNVIHFGPPTDMDTLLQQIGRAGRDNEQSFHLLLYNNKQLRKCDTEILSYIRNEDICRRKLLLENYLSEPDESRILHSCCDICSKSCTCDDSNCKSFNMPGYEAPEELCSTVEPATSVSEEKRSELRYELLQYRDIIDETVDTGNLVSDDFVHGISNQVIEDIVSKCHNLKSPDDVYQICNIFSFRYAIEICEIITRVIDGVTLDWQEEVSDDDD